MSWNMFHALFSSVSIVDFKQVNGCWVEVLKVWLYFTSSFSSWQTVEYQDESNDMFQAF